MSLDDPSRFDDEPVAASVNEKPKGFVNKRREKIVAEIERNRRGEYKVPTWVLVAILVAIVGGVAALIIFVG